MKIVVQIEFCINCHSHRWCLHHDANKYRLYYNRICQLAAELVQENQQIEIKFLDQPEYYQKVKEQIDDNKYYDTKTQKAVYFPRLGAFEIYVDSILIFSKLLLNQWPNPKKIVNQIFQMLEQKQKGNDLSKFKLQVQKQSQLLKNVFKASSIEKTLNIRRTIDHHSKNFRKLSQKRQQMSLEHSNLHGVGQKNRRLTFQKNKIGALNEGKKEIKQIFSYEGEDFSFSNENRYQRRNDRHLLKRNIKKQRDQKQEFREEKRESRLNSIKGVKFRSDDFKSESIDSSEMKNYQREQHSFNKAQQYIKTHILNNFIKNNEYHVEEKEYLLGKYNFRYNNQRQNREQGHKFQSAIKEEERRCRQNINRLMSKLRVLNQREKQCVNEEQLLELKNEQNLLKNLQKNRFQELKILVIKKKEAQLLNEKYSKTFCDLNDQNPEQRLKYSDLKNSKYQIYKKSSD